MPLDYGAVNVSKYKRADRAYILTAELISEYLDEPADARRQREREARKMRSFAPHGTPGSSSVPTPGAATPATGLGFGGVRAVRERERTAIRVRAGVTYWGGGSGGAPLFVKAGELFREGEVDVVKRDGGEWRDAIRV
jgi:hypothetical protein